MRTRRKYSVEFKREAVEMTRAADVSVGQIARELGINANMLGPWLHEMTAPSLVLAGENDGGCDPRLNRLIHEALPNSELVILPNYKHSLILESGAEVADKIIDFIGGIDRQPRQPS